MPDLPEIPTDGNTNSLYAWIIGVLIFIVIVGIPAIVIFYEKKLTKVNDRLNIVIDDSIERMNSTNDTKEMGLNKIHEIVVGLKEVAILIGKNER